MFSVNSVLVVLCAILVAISAQAPKNVKKITEVDYDLNKDYVTLSVNLQDGPEGSIVDLESELFKEIPNEIYVSAVISKLSGKTEYKPMVKTGKQNMCDYMKQPEKEPILKMLLDRLNQFGQMDFSCPVKPGKFWLKGFYIEGASLPSYAPPGSYKVEFTVTKKEKEHILIFKMVWFANITLE